MTGSPIWRPIDLKCLEKAQRTQFSNHMIDTIIRPNNLSPENLIDSSSPFSIPACPSSNTDVLSCHLCSKVFSSITSRKRHERTHLGIRAYTCRFCKKSFSQSGHLNIHIRSHTGSKPYQCIKCGRSFARRDALLRHNLTHEGEAGVLQPNINS